MGLGRSLVSGSELSQGRMRLEDWPSRRRWLSSARMDSGRRAILPLRAQWWVGVFIMGIGVEMFKGPFFTGAVLARKGEGV